MMMMIMMILSMLMLPFYQSCHDEEDEDGEEVKSFEVGDQSLCLSVSHHAGLGNKLVCCSLSDMCPVSHK